MGSNFDSAIFYVYVALGKSINLSGLSLLICKVGLWGYALHVALVVKNPLANAGDVRDMGSIPGSGRSPGGGVATHSNMLAWRIPWTEEPGRLQSIGSQRVEHN